MDIQNSGYDASSSFLYDVLRFASSFSFRLAT